MKASNTTVRLALLLLVGSVVACDSSGNGGGNPPATNEDAGTDSSSVADSTVPGTDSAPDSPSTVSEGGDSTVPGTDSGGPSEAGEGSTPFDAPSLETGSCQSDASTCNTCYTPAQAAADPYNGCSPYTAACIPFDPTRVPTHPTL
jgi:hypothetical protein